MAQRSTHELERRANGWAARLLEHKSILILALAAIAMASGLAMASLGGERDAGITIERAGSGTHSKDDDDSEHGSTSVPAKSTPTEVLYIDIDGAVATPGVYRLKDGARISDAIDAAGGLLESADVSSLNRAAKIADGQKIHVPAAGEEVVSSSADDAGVSSATSSSVSGLVNLNTATAEELQALSGVGPSTAQAIIEDRDAHGPFSSIEDLMRVSGIGEKKFEKLRSQVCI